MTMGTWAKSLMHSRGTGGSVFSQHSFLHEKYMVSTATVETELHGQRVSLAATILPFCLVGFLSLCLL